MKYNAICHLNQFARFRPGKEKSADKTGVTFPELQYEGLSEAEFEYQELLDEEDFALERFKYSLLLTLMLWLVLFAAWGLTRLVF